MTDDEADRIGLAANWLPDGYYIVKGSDLTMAYQSNFFTSDLLDIIEQSPMEALYVEEAE